MKGTDRYQCETFVKNTLYILDVLYYNIHAFQRGERIPREIFNLFPLLHPKRDRLRLSEIVRYTHLSKKTVWKHLKRLCEIGLVKKLGKGYYTLANEVYKKGYEEYCEFRKEKFLIMIKKLIDGWETKK